jgi:hypothetical protein
MRHENIKILKPAAQLEAERLTAFDELYEIASAVNLAALAVIGMARELGGEEGELLANYLRDLAERLQRTSKQLLMTPDESFLQLHAGNPLPGAAENATGQRPQRGPGSALGASA